MSGRVGTAVERRRRPASTRDGRVHSGRHRRPVNTDWMIGNVPGVLGLVASFVMVLAITLRGLGVL